MLAYPESLAAKEYFKRGITVTPVSCSAESGLPVLACYQRLLREIKRQAPVGSTTRVGYTRKSHDLPQTLAGLSPPYSSVISDICFYHFLVFESEMTGEHALCD